ncbi:hypothetical protein [Streptomyces sp. NPDC048242]|uniref:hypothetical protein n=1 Tax=Streptomyces sp. NPDC048242 TaxID=3155026 RepID=UPI0034122A58
MRRARDGARRGHRDDGGLTGSAPGKNATDQPTPLKMPPARTPVLHMHGKYTYTVRILGAKTMADMPNDPPPAGTKALALLLRVEAEPRDRGIHAPTAELSIDYPSLQKDVDAAYGSGSGSIGNMLDGGMDYRTEDQMLYGGQESQGIDPVFGTLEANTVYYHWVWQFVSEKANLKGATLCETQSQVRSRANCIPIGPITTAS